MPKKDPEDRLGAALRENLKRRKAQARQRPAEPQCGADPAAGRPHEGNKSE
jgi:hypothetical protein